MSSNKGMTIIMVLSIIALLTIIGTIVIKASSEDIQTTLYYKTHAQARYAAESGIGLAKAEIRKKSINDILKGSDGDVSKEDDNGIFHFGKYVNVGSGSVEVFLEDNDDDTNPYVDVDNIAVLYSTGIMKNGSRYNIEMKFSKIKVAPSLNMRAAVMTCGPIGTNGNLVIDGRDHDLNGNLMGPGVLSISSRSTNVVSGNVRLAGTSLMGVDYGLTKKVSDIDQLTEENTGSWGFPLTPETAMNINGVDDLKKIAKNGYYGSQYVTDPLDLEYPLSGVTYVELPDGGITNDIDFGLSSGLLIVHNNQKNAALKNPDGCFKGVIIADDYIHHHGVVIGAVITLKSDPSLGNVFGNGNGYIAYSSQAIGESLSLVTSYIHLISWKENF